ncbi:hypothetical protein Q3G72_030084 [Acer saccharum]|nr:hypothetical protein Q3G72_030084 [Acer saccharum]
MTMMMPTGFRFNPTDEELIQILQTKASGQPMLLHFNFIVQRNVYEHDPQHLHWDETPAVKDNEKYCYCMKENDSREVSGQGWWKATGHVKKIYASSSNNQTLEWRLCRIKYKGKPSAQEELENIRKASSSNNSMGMQPDSTSTGDHHQQNPDHMNYEYEAHPFVQNIDQQHQSTLASNDPFQTQFTANYYFGDQLNDEQTDSISDQLFTSLWSWQN